MVGGTTGYKNTPQNSDFVMFVVLPVLSVGVDNFRVEMGYIPKVSDEGTNVITLSFNIKY